VTNSFTNVDNVDLFIHSATVGFDDVSAISVEPVSLLTAHQYHHDRRHLGPAVYPGDSPRAADLRTLPLDAPPEMRRRTYKHETNKEEALVLLLGILVGLGNPAGGGLRVQAVSAQRS